VSSDVNHTKTIELDTKTKSQGGHLPGKRGKVPEFVIGQGTVGEIRKSQRNCGLPVVCCCSFDRHNVNTTFTGL